MFKYYTKWLSSAVSVAECWSYPGTWWTWRPIMPSLSSGTLKKKKETSVLNLVNDRTFFQLEAVVKKKRKPWKQHLRETAPVSCFPAPLAAFRPNPGLQHFHDTGSETPCGNSVSWSEDNHFTSHDPRQPVVASHAFQQPDTNTVNYTTGSCCAD